MGLFDQSPFELLTGRKSPIEKKMTPLQTEYAKGTLALTGSMFSPASLATGGWSNAWSALGTTGKVVVGTGGGLLAGWGISSLFGGKAQTQAQSFAPQNPIQNTYTNTFSNQVTKTNQITGDWSSNIIYSSPGASIKKGNLGGQAGPVSPSLTPQVSVVPNQSASQQGTQGQGTDWATLAAIAGVALVAYGYTSRKGGAK